MAISTFTITPPTRSTIFLHDLTVVDHAYIDDKGCIVGGSFNPSFEVSGTPDPVEKVVVDFSTIKHDIKELIDAHTFAFNHNGFDHKVWIIEGYSNVTNLRIEDTSGNNVVTILTPAVALTVPGDAVKMIPQIDGRTPQYTNEYIGAAFAEYLQPRLEEKYPNINIEVKCTNTENIHTPTRNVAHNAYRFRYVHGLKDSTSYGCNNIAHGHGSFISSEYDPSGLLEVIAKELDNTLFIRKDNIAMFSMSSDAISELTIQYTTRRGKFILTVVPSTHKIVILNTETTVEFLAAYVKERFGSLMKASGMTSFYISEGLSKGAVETL